MRLVDDINKVLIAGYGIRFYNNVIGQMFTNAHHVNGPAWINKEGYIGYDLNGRFHNTKGPARTYSSQKVEYWINGFSYKDKQAWEIAFSEMQAINRKLK